MSKETPEARCRRTGDWWTANKSPWTGCPRLALPPDKRPEGCRRCWLPGLLTGPYGATIHGDPDPGKVMLHPERLAQVLKARKPERYGWINGEPPWDRPEYVAAAVGVAMARPECGFGVPTSNPAKAVEWCRQIDDSPPPFDSHCLRAAEDLLQVRVYRHATGAKPRNWLWLISASTPRELARAIRYGLELGRMGWRWGLHLEPWLGGGPGEIVWHAVATREVAAPLGLSWVVLGGCTGPVAPPLHPVVARSVRDQCADAGVPFWFKGWGEWEPRVIDEDDDEPAEPVHIWTTLSGGPAGYEPRFFDASVRVGKRRAGRLLDGVEHNGLPEGWPQ